MSAEGNQHIAQVSGSTLVCVCGVHVFLGFSSPWSRVMSNVPVCHC